MHSIKAKLFSLAMAGGMLLALVGCNMSTPSTVGSIGGVEIPAGVYLLMQYNAYTTASRAADLATGESANDVKTVLKAQCTGTIGDEEVTATGAEYVEKLTTRSMEYYAAVEKTFADLGGELDDSDLETVSSNADSLWSSNGDLYQANGIARSSLETYLQNSQKAKKILELTYGENGTTPVTEDEYKTFIADNCYYIETVQFPLINYSNYTVADTDQKTAIADIAEQCRADLAAQATGETASSSTLYTAAMTYVPQAMSELGTTLESAQAVYYAASQLFTPSSLSSYDSDDGNRITDPLDAVAQGEWTTIDLGSAIMVARRLDPLKTGYTVENFVSSNDLLSEMKSTDLQNDLYAAGAAMDHALDASAVKTYAASKIKKTV